MDYCAILCAEFIAPMTPAPSYTLSAPDGFRGIFRTDTPARAIYSEGAGVARTWPAAVAVPADTEDLALLVTWAAQTGVGLIPRGSGTGMAAGAVGPDVIVDLSRFTQLEAIDHGAKSIRCGAGVICAQVNRVAWSSGYRFPVDPSSAAFCTVGGMTGTNASGARTLRFGSMRRWVRAIHCIFDDGSSAWISRDRPPPTGIPAVARLVRLLGETGNVTDQATLTHAGVRKESSGYAIAAALGDGGHLVDLLVGSEGTLAFFTHVELALTPTASATSTIMAMFPSLEAATVCATDIRIAGATACELLDRTFLDVAERSGPTGIPQDAEAVLLVEVEGSSIQSCLAIVEAVNQCCRNNDAISVTTSSDREQEKSLWALRHAASPILAQLAPRLRSMQFIEDGCVPPERFAAYVRGVRRALDRFETTGVIFGHAGDAHAHVNPLIDTGVRNWRERVYGLLDTVCDLTAGLGGTLSGEHGDGRLRASLLSRVWPTEALAAFAKVKAAADPAGILNPGCKLDLQQTAPSAQSLGTLRYDPDTLPLPTPVRLVLDDVERTRSWHRFRLGLLQMS